jgi:dipeptidase
MGRALEESWTRAEGGVKVEKGRQIWFVEMQGGRRWVFPRQR